MNLETKQQINNKGITGFDAYARSMPHVIPFKST